MTTAIVITIVSDDKPGIVEALSQRVSDHSGNWTESSMMRLGGQFAGLALVHIPSDKVEGFLAAVAALEQQGMSINAQVSKAPAGEVPCNEFSLELIGQDHPGIVAEITEVLAAQGVNVVELETTVQSASMSGESLFIAHARLSVPDSADTDTLQDELEKLANELMVEIRLDD